MRLDATWLAPGLAAALSALTGACRDKPREPERTPPANSRQPAEPALASARVALTPSVPWRLPARGRVVAFGDVHGDLAATRQALRLAGALDTNDHWKGGELVVVQTGDQLDRGDEEREVLDLLERVADEARRSGGALHVLNGNHELMNVEGDFRYVTPRGFTSFAEFAPSTEPPERVARFPAEVRGRAAAFLPGGPAAMKLAQRNTIAMVGDTLFVHGGVLPAHAADVGSLNEEIRLYIAGRSSRAPSSMTGERSPVWTRYYSEGAPGREVCATLGTVLAKLDATRMVVGHTPQKDGINSVCDGRLWRIDVGMAKAYGGRPAVLEITGGEVRVIADPAGDVRR